MSFQELKEKLFLWKMPDDPIVDLVNKYIKPITNQSVEMTKQCYNFFFLFFFSFIWAKVKSPKIRHIMSVFCGLFVLLFDFGLFSTLFFLAVEISTWVILMFKRVREHPVFVMIYAFFFDFLSLFYYYCRNYGEWRMDISTPIMLYVQKSSSLVWNLYDYRHRNDLSAQGSPRKLSSHLLNNSLEEVPSFFNYFSFMLFPVTLNLGPSVEYKMYLESVNSVEMPQGSKRFRWVGQNLALGSVFLTYYLLPTKWDLSFDLAQKGNHGLPYRILCTWGKIHWNRYKYYGPWLLTNAFVIICGLGYENGSWEHSINLFAGRVERSRRPHDFIAYWNCGTQRFLKYYIYVRGPISPRTGRVHPMMMYVTNAVSAIWHGWYAGYLVTFGSVVLVTFIEKWYYEAFPLTGYEEYEPYGVILTAEEKQQRRTERREERERKKKEKRDRREKEREKEKNGGQGASSNTSMGVDKDKGSGESQGQGQGKGKGVGFYVRAVVEWLVLQSLIDYASGAFFVLTWDKVKELYGFVDYSGSFAIGILFVFFFVLSFFTGKGKGKEKGKGMEKGKEKGKEKGNESESERKQRKKQKLENANNNKMETGEKGRWRNGEREF